MSLALVAVAQADRAKIVLGFDGKFIIEPGFKFKLTKGQPIYVEDSGFKRQTGDNKGDAIMTYFLCNNPEADKKTCLNLNALQRGSVSANADKIETRVMTGVTEEQAKNMVAPLASRESIDSFLDRMDGKTIVLAGLTTYRTKANGRKFNAKAYHWTVE